jgi:hypothetical protein
MQHVSPEKIDFSIFTQSPLPYEWAGNCFGCSPKNPAGFHLHFWFHNEECWSKCRIPNHFCGFDGITHGGIVATLLDEIAAWALGAYFEAFGFTTIAQIKYLKPVPTETELILHGVVLTKDRNKPKTVASILNQKGWKLAECESEWMLPSIDQIAYITKLDKSTLQAMIDPMIQALHHFKDKST